MRGSFRFLSPLSVFCLHAALGISPLWAATVPVSSTDVWDVSRGTVVTATSGMTSGSDARDMFGGSYSSLEKGNGIFSDTKPAGFVHYVEWNTSAAVTIDSLTLFATGDPPVYNYEREFGQFTLRAKSSPAASTYDVVICSCIPTHPYTFVDPTSYAVLVTNITPVTAQYFRAEFTQYTAGRGYDGPRIVELDAFAPVVEGMPAFTQQPVSQVATAGGSVAFTALAESLQPISYQWLKNGAAIPGKTDPTLTLQSLQLSDSGAYALQASNALGVAVSSSAVLTVNPSVISQLINVDFACYTLVETGPAAVGKNPNDFWNPYTAPYIDDSGLANLKNSAGTPTAVGFRLQNGGGHWSFLNGDTMFRTYCYSRNPGSMVLTVTNLPKAFYSFYLYGHGGGEMDNSLFTLKVGGNSYGTKATTLDHSWASAVWTEGAQYVVFPAVEIPQDGVPLTVLVDLSASGYNFLAGLQIAALPPQCLAAPAGIVSWWPGEGTADDVAFTNHGAFVGTPSYDSGLKGKAFNFSGSNYVKIPNSPSLNPPGSFSFETWVKPLGVSTQQEALICKWQGTGSMQNQRRYVISIESNAAIRFAIADYARQWDTAFQYFDTDPGVITRDTWTHVAAVYDQPTGTRRIYVNGVLVKQRTDSPLAPYDTIAPVTLGAGTSSPDGPITSGLHGLMDEPAVYNTALSATDVQAIFNARDGGKCLDSVPPVIIEQPQGVAVNEGSEARFRVVAWSSAPLTYQWQKNGTPIPGANAAEYLIPAAQKGDEGAYSVVVSTLNAFKVSAPASLIVSVMCAPVTAGIVSWWRAEGNANDWVGTNNGVFLRHVSYDPGEVGSAFRLYGTNYVRVPNSPGLNPAGSFSLEAWVNLETDVTTDRAIISKWGDTAEFANQRSYLLALRANGAMSFAIADYSRQWSTAFQVFDTAPGLVQKGAWTHVVASYEHATGTRRIYINGTKAAERTDTPLVPYSTTSPVSIGAVDRGGGQVVSFFPGRIDEATLYARALTPTEISSIYQASAFGKCANRSPKASPFNAGTKQDQPVSILKDKLLLLCSDPDGDAIAITGVSPTSTNGAPVVLSANNVTYTPAPGFIGTDRFTYSVSDVYGATSSAEIVVEVRSANLPTANMRPVQVTEAGTQVSFLGIPGLTYTIQRAPAASGPWSPIGTATVGADGFGRFTDPNPPAGSAFYRTVYSSN